MWYLCFKAWKDELRDTVMPLQVADKEMCESMGWKDPRAIFDYRCHGNPLLEMGTAVWHKSVYEKRGENPIYFKERSIEPYAGMMEQYSVIATCYTRVEGLYLIDHDDPELIEYGDEGMHERLTSQVADFLKKPNDPEAYALSEQFAPHLPLERRKKVVDGMYKYFEDEFFANLESGYLQATGICVETFRQSRGFPYQFVGADIED